MKAEPRNASPSRARRWLDLLLPAGCVVCRRWIPRDELLRSGVACGRCRSRLHRSSWPRCPRCHHPRGTGRGPTPDCLECRPWPAELARARYAWILEEPASDLVHALKYEGWRELADPMGGDMARVVAAEPECRAQLVVPVPTTEARIRTRGYNQAALLAAVVARALALPLEPALDRRGAVRSQTALTPAERRDNVRDAFHVWGSAAPRLRDLDVLLVDDVLTTGATAGEAATSLVRAGARSVTLVAFARALPSRSVRRAA